MVKNKSSSSEKLIASRKKIQDILQDENKEIKKLIIPNFQRPYEWDTDRVEQFVKDLEETFRNKKNDNFEYLIGNMVFYQINNECEIVDGQQRIITLGIIFYVLGEKEEDNKLLQLEFKTYSSLTEKNINQNKELIENFFKNYSNKNEFKDFLLKNVVVNILETYDLDFAFFLFDSHNSRGKPLDRKDLLKVHHIRLIKKEDERPILARKWESYEKVDDTQKDKLKEILQLLAVCRKAIRGELEGDDLIESDVYKEFLSEANEYHLNNYNQPPIFEEFEYDVKTNILKLKTKSLKTNLSSEKNDAERFLPFQIPQSIEGGEKFFYFVIKYFNLLSELEKTHKDIFNLFDKVSGSGNQYINSIYKPLLVLFYDKFGEENLKEFAFRLIIIFTYLRIDKIYVRKETMVNNFAKPYSDKIDLFKLIFLSYSTEVILNKLNDYIRFEVGDKDISETTGTARNFIYAWEHHKKDIFEILEKSGRKWINYEQQ
ncbi:MAG: hypothetical protein KatS3mg034_0670 [Vicingaceae bacterium]|nr:MAG: hypothetical protein KatS3mg034_0666 [Vicingaceae bacterium]GIV41360.1 MAG: hypothetical protein KatS3mg034_0670 [Vicingaceae bacterium]